MGRSTSVWEPPAEFGRVNDIERALLYLAYHPKSYFVPIDIWNKISTKYWPSGFANECLRLEGLGYLVSRVGVLYTYLDKGASRFDKAAIAKANDYALVTYYAASSTLVDSLNSGELLREFNGKKARQQWSIKKRIIAYLHEIGLGKKVTPLELKTQLCISGSMPVLAKQLLALKTKGMLTIESPSSYLSLSPDSYSARHWQVSLAADGWLELASKELAAKSTVTADEK